MLGVRGFDLIRKQFADQFEPDGDGFFYRRYGRDAAIRVTADEKQRFIATFNCHLKFAFWGMMVAIVALAIICVTYAVETNTEISDRTIYIGLGVITVAFIAANFWARSLPTRELRYRATVGERRSRDEMRRLMIEKITYGQLAMVGLIGVYCLLRVNYHADLLSGFNAFWLIGGALDLVLALIQAFRKWRFEFAKKA